MRSRKTILACSALVIVQVAGAFGFIPARTSAQADELVAVIIGEKTREACEVQDRRSDDGNWGEQSIEGPPVACEGGLVTAVIATQEEAAQAVARTEATTESAEVSVIPLTGDAVADEETISSEMVTIHQVSSPRIAIRGRSASKEGAIPDSGVPAPQQSLSRISTISASRAPAGRLPTSK